MLKEIPTSKPAKDWLVHRINREAKAIGKTDITLYVRGESIAIMNRGLMGEDLNQEEIDKYIYKVFEAILNHEELEPKITLIQTNAFTDTEASAGKAFLKLGVHTRLKFQAHYPFEVKDEDGRVVVAYSETEFKKRFL